MARGVVSIDPFARNCQWATYTNDLNPDTKAKHHMDAVAFCEKLHGDGVIADLVIFDPPYSPRQIAECYKGFGRTPTMKDTQTAALFRRARRALSEVLKVDGIALSFGWNTVGMGEGFETIEVLNVCHGGGHNDTICMAQRKTTHQLTFPEA